MALKVIDVFLLTRPLRDVTAIFCVLSDHINKIQGTDYILYMICLFLFHISIYFSGEPISIFQVTSTSPDSSFTIKLGWVSKVVPGLFRTSFLYKCFQTSNNDYAFRIVCFFRTYMLNTLLPVISQIVEAQTVFIWIDYFT